MPFITEEIYQSLPHADESIMISDYPKYEERFNFSDDASKTEDVISAIKAIRARRNEMNVIPSRRAKIYIVTSKRESFNESTAVFFGRLASASDVEISENFDSLGISADDNVQIITDAASIYLPLADIIDAEKEKEKLAAELKKTEGEIARLDGKLSNEGFIAKAPAAVVDGEREKLAKYRDKLEGIKQAIAKLG